ncbi:1285_t:CDS:2, partial [Diversispora eburnea]
NLSANNVSNIIPISQEQFDKLKKLQDAYQIYVGLDIYSWQSVKKANYESLLMATYFNNTLA